MTRTGSPKTKKSNLGKPQKVIHDTITEKATSNNNQGTNVSVITKTNKPKVIIQSEKVSSPSTQNRNIQLHCFFKIAYLITISLIILITFFLSLKTYNIVVNTLS